MHEINNTDIKGAMDDLARQVQLSAHPPGAEAAIRSARMRRAGTVASIAVTVALAASAVVAPQLLPTPVTTMIAGAPQDRDLNAEALEEATAGWVAGWREEQTASGAYVTPDCRMLIASAWRGKVSAGSSLFSSTDGSSVKVMMLTFADREEAQNAFDQQVSAWQSCSNLSESTLPSQTGDDVALHFSARVDADGHKLSDLWVARAGSRVSVMFAAAVVPASEAVVEAMSDALVDGTRSGWVMRNEASN